MLAQIALFGGFDPLAVVAPYEVLGDDGEAVGGKRSVPNGSSSDVAALNCAGSR